MWFFKKQKMALESTKSRGDACEKIASDYLIQEGLVLVARNYRTPGRGGGEIDLIMRTKDDTLVFVEVRQRSSSTHGGAAASITSTKQQRIILAAQHYLMRFAHLPPCRFDVVLVDHRGQVQWLPAAFEES